MLGAGKETPSRYELLSMVKKHSTLLGKCTVDEQDAGDVGMDGGFWHDVFDLYFIGGKECRGRQDDDMIFFVRKMGLQGYGFNDRGEEIPPYFVRRWAPELDKLIGESSTEVDWRRSFYLNMIAHTSFSVTVAICSNQVLRNHQVGKDTSLSPIYKVVKTVYASPSRVNFHLDSKKEVETTPAYPDICFAIDDFDSTFDAVVLTDTDHCYCVLLNAHDGAAFPGEKEPHESSSSSDPSLRTVTKSGVAKNTKLTLFSGFVSYQMVRDAYDAGRSRFGSLLSIGHSSGKTDRLYMKGPGGRGWEIWHMFGCLDNQKGDNMDLFFFTQLKRVSTGKNKSKKFVQKVGSGTWFHESTIAVFCYNRQTQIGPKKRFRYESKKMPEQGLWNVMEFTVEDSDLLKCFPKLPTDVVLCRIRYNFEKGRKRRSVKTGKEEMMVGTEAVSKLGTEAGSLVQELLNWDPSYAMEEEFQS